MIGIVSTRNNKKQALNPMVGIRLQPARCLFCDGCVKGMVSLLATIANKELRLTKLGEIAAEGFRSLPSRFPLIETPIFCVMPNHAHAIVSNTKGHFGEDNGVLQIPDY